jgi:enoyl-[acyl-carrier protein] reductase II
VTQAHDAGILFIQQVHTAKQARQAADLGVDALIAQGSESGGFCASVSALSSRLLTQSGITYRW